MLPSPQPRYTTEGPEGVDVVVAVIDGETVVVVVVVVMLGSTVTDPIRDMLKRSK